MLVSVLGLATSAPSVGLPFTCEPSVYMKSLGFHFMLRGLVYSIVVIVCDLIGAGLSVYVVVLSTLRRLGCYRFVLSLLSGHTLL